MMSSDYYQGIALGVLSSNIADFVDQNDPKLYLYS
jgi:hypothetical protein